MSHIGNTFTYGAAGIATALGLIGLGKVGQFLKSNGSIVSAGLLTGVATAAAVPLTKRAVVFLPPEIYADPRMQLIGTFDLPGKTKDKVDFVLSCIASLGLSLVVTALLTNRLTNFISGYRLSYPKLAGVSLLSGVISGVGFGAGSLLVKQQISREQENRSEQSSILAQYLAYNASSFLSLLVSSLRQEDKEINEANIAKVLEKQLNPEEFAQALSLFNEIEDWTHHVERSTISLSPFKILAHVQNSDTRYLIYEQCPFMQNAVGKTLGTACDLESYPAAERLGALNGQLREQVDAETLAMCISFSPRYQEALLNAVETSQAFGGITRQDVEAHLPPPVTRNYPRGLLDQLNGGIHQETALGQLAQHLHSRGITDPKAYAKVLEQLKGDHVIAHLNYMYQQRDFNCFPRAEYSVTLSPFFVLAHFKDPQQRDRIFMRTQMYEMAKGTIEPQYTSLSEYSAQSRIEELKPSLGSFIDASVFAMIFSQVKDSELLEALLAEFERGGHYGIDEKQITREAIEAAMSKSLASQLEIPPFTTDEGITAALAGLGTFAITSAILTTMILTSRLAVWTWASYPTIRGVFPTATLVAVGYMVGKTATNNSKIGYLAAFVLGTFVSPKANRLISSHEMSYWHGAGFSIVGILGYSLMNQEPARRRSNLQFE